MKSRCSAPRFGLNDIAPMQNLLIASLSADDRALIAPHLDRIDLRGGRQIASCDDATTGICFPETLVASVGEVLDNGSRLEIGLIGREGLIGWPILLGGRHPPHCGVVLLGGGTASTLPAAKLMDLCEHSRSLHLGLLRFVQSFTVQMGRTIVTNLRDGIDSRLARWLLMLHDRVDGDILPITHFELAGALNVRRASVTDWLHILEGDRALRCARGQITIRDRAVLEGVAGDCYGPAENTYRDLVADFGKRHGRPSG